MRQASLLLVALCLLSLSCYETAVSITDPVKATVDRALIGDWSFPAAGDAPAYTVVVRNIDDHRYYVEWFTEGKMHERGVATMATVKDATFAELRNLTDDGSIPDKHILMRVEMKQDKLGIRQLSEPFFNDHPAATPDALRKVLEANVNNDALYEGAAQFATRAPTS